MPDANDLIKAMKRAAIEAVEASKPVNICFGEVTDTSPIKIRVEQKMTLGRNLLLLSQRVTDYTADMVHEDGSSEEVTIKNALKKGENVILFRQQDGQKYIVVDRIGVM